MKNAGLFFLLFAAPAVGYFFYCVWKSPWVPRLRCYSVIPYAIFGGFGIHLYSNIHRHHLVKDIPGSEYAHVSVGINGVVGILAAAWTLIAAIWLAEVGEKPAYRTAKPQGRQCFFFFCIDVIIIAFLIAAAALGFQFLPQDVRQCGTLEDTRLQLFGAVGRSIGESPAGGCRRAFAVEVLGIFTIILAGAQCVLLATHMALPAPFRAVVFFNIRLLQKLARLNSLLKLLGIQSGRSGPLAIELKPCCVGKARKECWACSSIVCEDCRVLKTGFRIPRTTKHANNCYSICTQCYLFRSYVDAAPVKSTWHSEKLSLQHSNCTAIVYTDSKKNVDLCSRCAGLDKEEVVVSREEKERLLVAKLTERRLRCSTCDSDLPKKRRRWWICEHCTQECHWAGHRT